jgi:hypothetical protein
MSEEAYVLKTVTVDRVKGLIQDNFEGEDLMKLAGEETKVWRDCGRRKVSDNELLHTLNDLVERMG